MKLNTIFIINAIVSLLFGLANLFFVNQLASSYGYTLGDGGRVQAQLLGSALVGIAVMLFFATKAKDTKAIVTGMFVFNVVGLIAAIFATINNVWNSTGWVGVALFLIFSIAFLYFMLKK